MNSRYLPPDCTKGTPSEQIRKSAGLLGFIIPESILIQIPLVQNIKY